jgi:hypothetical protein
VTIVFLQAHVSDDDRYLYRWKIASGSMTVR